MAVVLRTIRGLSLIAVAVAVCVPAAFGQQMKRGYGVPARFRTTQVQGPAPSFPHTESATPQLVDEAGKPQFEVVEGGTYYEHVPDGGMMTMDAATSGACCNDGSCGQCLAPCRVLPLGNLEMFAGVQGFTGPSNREGTGSFGFHEGINWAIPIPGFSCLGAQFGFRATQSHLSGNAISSDARTQAFVTGGLFRRVDVGLQGGLVVDYLSESYYRDADLTQVRGEISWIVDGCHDLGFWFAGSSKSSQEAVVNNELVTWEPTDLFAFFYRHQFGACRDGFARIFLGWTGDSDGYLGTDLRVPLTNMWALETGFAYLIPNEGNNATFNSGHIQEAWNVGISIVWTPGRAAGQDSYYYRPLFGVADNSNFMIDRR